MIVSRSASGTSSPTVTPHARVIGRLAGFAYVRRPSRVTRSTGFGFWSGNLSSALTAVTSVP